MISFRSVEINFCIISQDVYIFKFMPLTYLVVIKVMSWGNFYTTCAKFHIDIIVSNDWNLSISQWQIDHLSDQVLVTRIIRMNRHSAITKHGFWPSCGNHHNLIRVRYRVSYVPQRSLFFGTNHFKVRHSSQKYGIPINEPLSTIN